MSRRPKRRPPIQARARATVADILAATARILECEDGAGTYAYVDTCGKSCNGASQATSGGVWHVSQTKMHTAITSFGAGYAR